MYYPDPTITFPQLESQACLLQDDGFGNPILAYISWVLDDTWRDWFDPYLHFVWECNPYEEEWNPDNNQDGEYYDDF